MVLSMNKLVTAAMLLFGVLVLLFFMLLVWRLGPDGYSRTQANGAFSVLCEQIKKYHPDFVCPAIGR